MAKANLIVSAQSRAGRLDGLPCGILGRLPATCLCSAGINPSGDELLVQLYLAGKDSHCLPTPPAPTFPCSTA